VLSIRRQCKLLSVARSGFYRLPIPANDNDSALMRRIDEVFTAWPFLGSRRILARTSYASFISRCCCTKRLAKSQ
jgi:putative transposase